METLAWQQIQIPVVGKPEYRLRPKVSMQIPRVGIKLVGRYCPFIVTFVHAYLLSNLSVHHLLRDSCRKLPMKRNSFYLITDLCFSREPVRLQHGPVEMLNPFLLILFQHRVSKRAKMLPLFLLF